MGRRLLRRARASPQPFRPVGTEALARVAGTVLRGGVVAVAEPRPSGIARSADVAQWAREGRPLLLIDGIGNPHNLGAIARTAAFFGLPRIVLSDHPAQALPSDASYRVAEVVWSTSRYLGGRPFETLSRSDRPIAMILGNEEDGLPPSTLESCHELVTIPGAGSVQSLNVAVSAAILIHRLAADLHAEPLRIGASTAI